MISQNHPSFLRKWTPLFVLSLAIMIIVIDTTLLNVSLGIIIRDLKTTIQKLQWVISAYSLMLAAFTITGGRMGDIFGRKRMFVLGAIIFAIGSFISSISYSFPVLLWGESIIEGIGAALMMPATASLLVSLYHGHDRSVAFGVWGGMAGAAASIGPLLGGFFTTYYTWRWGFRINIVVAAILVLGSLLIPEAWDTEEKPSLDWIGVILSSLGLTAIVFAIIEASTYGWWQAKESFVVAGHTLIAGNISMVPYTVALGIGLLVAFLLWERFREARGGTPLVSLHLFSNRQFMSGAVTMAVLSLGQAGIFLIIPIFSQAVRGLSAIQTALVLLPLSLSLLISSPLSGVLARYVTAKRLIQAGFVIDIIALFFLRQSLYLGTTTLRLVPSLILFGLGMGPIMSQISNLTMSAVSVQQAGEASGVNNTFRQVGATLGSSIIGAIILTLFASNVAAGITASAVIPASLKVQMAANISHQDSVAFGAPDTALASLPPALQSEIHTLIQRAMADAESNALLYGMAFVFLGFLVSFSLPNVKVAARKQPSVAAGH